MYDQVTFHNPISTCPDHLLFLLCCSFLTFPREIQTRLPPSFPSFSLPRRASYQKPEDSPYLSTPWSSSEKPEVESGVCSYPVAPIIVGIIDMFRQLAIASLALLETSCFTNAQTITLTTHISACNATYTSQGSTTIVVSTATVVPTPLTDGATNDGTPFVIALRETASGITRRQLTPYWLMANGNTTTNASMATHYQIYNGQLSTLDGRYFTTKYGISMQTFAASTPPEPINSTFSSINGILQWTNADFTNGTAQFYQLPPNIFDNALIMVNFVGPMESGYSWEQVLLMPEPCKQFHRLQ